MHIHFSPDHQRARRSGAIGLAGRAVELEMAGIVLKSHHYDTTPVAVTVMEAGPGVAVYGGIALNEAVGGLNPAAVEACAKMGGKIVWMPTRSAAADFRRKGKSGGIEICTGGKPLSKVIEILKIIKANDMILATGHIAPEESHVLLEAAKSLKLEKMLVTHAGQHSLTHGMTVDQMKQFVRIGAYIEFCAYVMTPLESSMPPQSLADLMREIGPERCVFSTDFGQAFSPIAPEGFRTSMAVLLETGMSEKDVRIMVQDNPKKLLGV